MTGLRTASAAARPCQLRGHHSPVPVITEGHHRHPVYLQNRVYGRLRDPELLWVCSNDHEAIHAWLYWLLGERAQPAVDPGRLAKAEAQRSYDWYTGAMRARP